MMRLSEFVAALTDLDATDTELLSVLEPRMEPKEAVQGRVLLRGKHVALIIIDDPSPTVPGRVRRNRNSKQRRSIRKRLVTKYRGRCALCGVVTNDIVGDDDQGTIDHIVPLSAGGTDSVDNMQWSCLSCNLKKGDRHG